MELFLKEWCLKLCFLFNFIYYLFGIVMYSGMIFCSGYYQVYVQVLKYYQYGNIQVLFFYNGKKVDSYEVLVVEFNLDFFLSVDKFDKI